MTDLESKLLDTLVKKYEEQGLGVHALLDNPDFIALSLDSKLKALDTYATRLNKPFKPNYMGVASKAAQSFALGGLSIGFARSMQHGAPFIAELQGPHAIAAASLSAGLSLAKNIYDQKKKYELTKRLNADISNNKYIDAIVDNGLSRQMHQSAIVGSVMPTNPFVDWASSSSNQLLTRAPAQTN